MATCSNILARRIPWTEEPRGLQSKGSKRAGHGSATEHIQSTALTNMTCMQLGENTDAQALVLVFYSRISEANGEGGLFTIT